MIGGHVLQDLACIIFAQLLGLIIYIIIYILIQQGTATWVQEQPSHLHDTTGVLHTGLSHCIDVGHL